MSKITLRAARINANLTQNFVADYIGVHRSTLGKWERGEAFPDAATFAQMCELYRLSMDDIFLIKATT